MAVDQNNRDDATGDSARDAEWDARAVTAPLTPYGSEEITRVRWIRNMRREQGGARGVAERGLKETWHFPTETMSTRRIDTGALKEKMKGRKARDSNGLCDQACSACRSTTFTHLGILDEGG